jgi:CHASE2 domain-containing sensor protein
MSHHEDDHHQDSHIPPNQPKKKKGFRHHARKVHGRVTKYLIEKDTMFSTVWVFIFIVVLGSIPLNLGTLNPIKLGLKDFDFNDLYYSHVGNEQYYDLDTNITVIDIDQADREGIAMLIDKAAQSHPKVMGLDVTFDSPRDPQKDSILTEVIKRNKNLVLAVKYQTDSAGKLIAAQNVFKNDSTQFGYVNFPNTDQETIRYYYPFRQDDHDKNLVLPSFTSTLLKNYSANAYEKVKDLVNEKTPIAYSRRVTEKKRQYFIAEPEELMADQIDQSRLTGKIVLFAYAKPFEETDIEDKKFTPMNEKYYGKSWPDMNGIFVHANILSMAMENKFIKKVPLWGNILLAVIVCWLHMSFFIHYYLESHIWFHLAAKLAQVLSAFFFIWLGSVIYSRYHLKVDMKWSLITIALAVDVIYFYEAWAVWMHKKFGYKTVFKPHHH